MNIGKSILAVIAVIVFLLMATAGGWVWRWYTAPIKGKIDAREHIESKDHRLYGYEHFYDLHAAYKATKGKLENQKEMLPHVDGIQETRTRQNIAAIKSQLAKIRSEYNEDSKKTKTLGKFKSWDLPKRLGPVYDNQ